MSSVWDKLQSGWATAINTAQQSVQTMTSEWSNAVADFKRRAAEFTQVYSQLLAAKSKAANAAQASKIDALLSRGEWVRKTLAQVASAIDIGAHMLPKNLLSGALSGGRLGVLPLVPIAVIVGGISVMTAWIADAKVELERINLAERVRAEGGDPSKVLFDGFQWSPWMWIPVAGVLSVITWQLMAGGKRGG